VGDPLNSCDRTPEKTDGQCGGLRAVDER
jgi:hypothetical protein